MHLLEIDKYDYKLNETLVIPITPGTYIDLYVLDSNTVLFIIGV